MKFASLALALLSLSAFADTSPVVGTWSSACDTQDGMNYMNRATFREDGTLVNEDLMFPGAGCTGTPEVTTSEGKYTLESDSPAMTVMNVIPNKASEGEPVFMKLQFNHVNSATMTMKLLAATVIVEGQRVEVPADQLPAFPVVTYTRN